MPEPGRYRKRPVEVEAMLWDGSLAAIHDIDEWIGLPFEKRELVWQASEERGVTDVVIRTLEGDMSVSPGDWIIRGIQGELYPCKPNIFTQTYEPVPFV